MLRLKYYEDALLLTRKSLEFNKVKETSYLQLYTIGEILRNYGYTQDSIVNFNLALKIKPNYKPALRQLKQIEGEQTARDNKVTFASFDFSISLNTFILIIILISGVICVVLSILYERNDAKQGGMKNLKRRQAQGYTIAETLLDTTNQNASSIINKPIPVKKCNSLSNNKNGLKHRRSS